MRHPYYLLTHLKFDNSVYSEHFYSLLQPWVHFILVAADLSDLLEKVEWARENDDEVRAKGEQRLQAPVLTEQGGAHSEQEDARLA